MRIFITGASGFIGRHVAALLNQDGHDLLILSRNSLPQAQSQTLVGDLKDLNPLKEKIAHFDPEVCLHLAWEGIPDFSYEKSKSNLDHSLNLIEWLANHTACRKIIASGSSWETGKGQGICREEDPSVASSYFTWAKNALHACGALLCAAKNIDFVWLRIFFAFGPGQRKNALIPTLYHAFKNGIAPDIKNPLNAQDFIDVRDVAEAFRLTVKVKIPSGIYNIGNEAPLSVSEISSLVEEQTLKRSPKHKFPETAAASVVTWADTSKFRNATAWRPLISVQEGIKNHIEFLENA